jgi:hypothetical protein
MPRLCKYLSPRSPVAPLRVDAEIRMDALSRRTRGSLVSGAALRLLRFDQFVDAHWLIEVWDLSFAQTPKHWRTAVTLE